MKTMERQYDEESGSHRWGHTGKKSDAVAKGVHHMNKNEAHQLRVIQDATGLTEEEIKANKEYRTMLSHAQDAGEKPKFRDKEKKVLDAILASAVKQCHRPPTHPKVIALFNERCKAAVDGETEWGTLSPYTQVPYHFHPYQSR